MSVSIPHPVNGVGYGMYYGLIVLMLRIITVGKPADFILLCTDPVQMPLCQAFPIRFVLIKVRKPI